MSLRSRTSVYESNGVAGQSITMVFVYVLVSKKYPRRCYIGMTNDIERRLSEHNESDSIYTKKYAPWELKTYVAFKNRSRATEFERYLKSGSGFSFLKKRFL